MGFLFGMNSGRLPRRQGGGGWRDDSLLAVAGLTTVRATPPKDWGDCPNGQAVAPQRMATGWLPAARR
ncbi:MAG TPA: hypothetical protein VNK73_19325 [Actinomycetota bacterium]|nr:hypothetical protein [Actinomycetota bacterium]